MKVSVIGAGYVGLVSGACLADKGHRVICVDLDQRRVDQINRGEAPIYERGLPKLLQRNAGDRLTATTDLAAAVRESELSLIAVGTPFDGSAIDLGAIEAVCRQMGEALAAKSDYHVVLVKSTVVPGTTDAVVRPLLERASGKVAGRDFGVGMNPEFLRQGNAVVDFLRPDRIVLGGMDDRTLAVCTELYAAFPGVDQVRTTPKTAEMIKYTANALLATQISFSNEIGNLCAALGDIDVVDVMRGVHLDRRLSPILPDGRRLVPELTTYLAAGCGFGGSCFPKDTKALIAHGTTAGVEMRLLQSVIDVNEKQPRQMLTILERHFADLTGVRVAVLGLAFKPDTDDLRESPSLPVIRDLVARGSRVQAYDPVAREAAEALLGADPIQYCGTLEEALDGADAVLLMTRWQEFARIPDLLRDRASQPLVIDGRRMLDKASVAHYDGIGL